MSVIIDIEIKRVYPAHQPFPIVLTRSMEPLPTAPEK